MENDTIISLETVCTCKVCKHGLAKECVEASCQCCNKASHSMVLDGMEGFMPAHETKPPIKQELAEVVDVGH